VAQKFHLAILRIEATRASRGLSAIAEILVLIITKKVKVLPYPSGTVGTGADLRLTRQTAYRWRLS